MIWSLSRSRASRRAEFQPYAGSQAESKGLPLANTWEEGISNLPADEARKRVTMALRCNYDAHRDTLPLMHLDNILNGRWFAVPENYGGEKPADYPLTWPAPRI